ncbi:HD domain-containing protein [Zymomonas mobilis]|uniref:ATP-binding region ATPase domain protein n=1 Tax=Zymomonas mobilis subsp. mobilis (strain ATCC 10988 / DSM 424 / LMG 404 / NCIMB 8938 / NRRL B-806 / ZM1) TaxID=555217 RepID=A0A0H3G0S4_ZYMMA|nr:ATP-binding protein [Zymomonas mobilis]AEH63621.1 ATP-binding region ATPase domain protein [Zymomonas mobilis subsp. mobilis ATCC 10988]TQL24948.1 histidine kinase/DNA gyrase B/HSP90-like ATPase [Zymomonas mobilis]
MAIRYDETTLWKRTIGMTGGNPREESALATLRSTFETAHDRIKPIVRQAHIDCQGLTIHDESHLDALWQLADIIAGDNYPLNPLEAFIFGCSVLFHDSALAVVAYEDGLDGLKKTAEWQRAMAQMTALPRIDKNSLSKDQRRQFERIALFSTVRGLHAKQAVKMVEREWSRPNIASVIYIIEDTELRDYYGQIIGRIAQSHHWDVDRLAHEFLTRRAPPPSLPAEWELNELKIAILLRCADAAHIDNRRAPLMDYILSSPKGVSALHWGFQNRLGIPSRGDQALIYNSGRDFGRSEADAWWLCFDTCRMISDELQSAASLLKESDTEEFFAKKVEGTQRPKLFAKYVHCDGWEPVDAEVRVTDPISLAQTLGGRNLYGNGYHAPLRELLQNAIDATLLRASIGREGFIPRIRCTLERSETGQLRLIVEDNGIGMSERVLTRRLLDFGRSGWKSEDVAQENPEISVASVNISGKFGIGFFSVFLLGDEVTVVTRRYKDGIGNGLALEFVGLTRRPILRKAAESEQSDIYTTRISIAVTDQVAINGFLPQNNTLKHPKVTNFLSGIFHSDVFSYLRWLTASSAVEIEFVDKVASRSFTHAANWSSRSSEEFIKDLTNDQNHSETDYVTLYSEAVTPIENDDGRLVGRAAIQLNSRHLRSEMMSFARVGGLTYPVRTKLLAGHSSNSQVPSYIGIIEGEAAIATRGAAQLSISPKSLAQWATNQAQVGINGALSVIEKVELARAVYWAGGDPLTLPIGYFDGSTIDLSTLKAILFQRDDIFLPILHGGSRRAEYRWATINDLDLRFYFDEMSAGTCIMASHSREEAISEPENETDLDLVFNTVIDENFQKLLKYGSYNILFDLLEKSGRQFKLRYELRQIFDVGLTANRSMPGIAVVFDQSLNIGGN